MEKKLLIKSATKAEMHIKESLEELMKKIDVTLKMKKYYVEALTYKVTINASPKEAKKSTWHSKMPLSSQIVSHGLTLSPKGDCCLQPTPLPMMTVPPSKKI